MKQIFSREEKDRRLAGRREDEPPAPAGLLAS